MKTTYIKIVVFVMFLISHCTIHAQYHGGISDGASLDFITNTSCSSLPPSFFAFLGGNADGASVDELYSTTCATAPSQFAFFGGNADGAATEELSETMCATPPSFYAFFGGNNDGAAVDTTSDTVCGFPSQFYAFFGGNGDGSIVDSTAPVCPTQPPVASFTASVTEVCVGQSVTFTDTSTNIPAGWTWTFTGGTPNSSTIQNPVITFNTPGIYTVKLIAANYNGTNTVTQTGYITVYANPTVSSTIPASRCGSGTVTLNATATVGTLNWYAAATGGLSLGTGTSFVTPSISTTTPFYVETINGVCTSARILVNATVNAIPTITSTISNARCGTGTVVLSAVPSAGNAVWYANATGGTALATTSSFTTPSISTTTTYYVEAATSTCTSTIRTAVIATINSTPTITSTTPDSRCGAGTLTLNAVANSGTLNWYASPSGGISLGTGTSFITPSLATSTTYYVDASIATCITPRIAVTATINDIPGITAIGSNSRCDAGSVIISASPSAGTVVWYADATGGTALATTNSFTTPSILTTTTYYAEAVNGSCTSGTRTPIIATINASPTITSTTPATICSGDTFTISAVTSAGSLAWYNVPTGGIVQGTGASFSLSNWAATTTFYVQATAGSCQSARIPVIVNVNQTPFNTTLSPANRCGTGSVTLSATYTTGTINWYDAPSGGNLVFTGSNFVTPSLSATTTYYVEGVNGTCTSSIRTAITATINAIPTVTSTTPASRCGAGIVTLNAASSIGSLSWYAAASGGSVLATGTTFSPNIATTTTYYVEATNATCTSTRTAVTATIDNLQTIISTTNATRCGTGNITLAAVATGGTFAWYANATGGSILQSGSNFVFFNLSTTTTVYVSVTNGTCTSARVAVTATITNEPAPTGTANQSFCTNETVGQLATNGTNVNWYDSASSTTVLPNSTPLVSGSTYYATQTISGCESSTRLAVTVITGNCLGDESFSKLVGLKLYPNPVIDILNVSYTDKISKIEITNVLGQYIDTIIVNTNDSQIDMSRLSSGTYLIKVITDDKSEVFKVIKK